jgi:murein DD-endopeptidase MepM/ murein hydrolase activator NlpD
MSMFHAPPCTDWREKISQGWGETPAVNPAGHNGIDFALPIGTEIFACHNGHVRVSEYQDTGFGQVIVVENEEIETTYGHLSERLVFVGDVVSAGDVIGLSGNTGASTGPHLHFGLRIQPWTYGGKWNGYHDPSYALRQFQQEQNT